MLLTQHIDDPSEVSKCFKFVEKPNIINHVLFYSSIHGEQVSDDLPVTATSAMAKWTSGEMDEAMVFPSDHDPITCDMQASMLE